MYVCNLRICKYVFKKNTKLNAQEWKHVTILITVFCDFAHCRLNDIRI
jgi:hypothetical protein